ncbi:MAG: hypothetical protein GY702_07040 [Desulfobulbaceae bacterium]|nr:hypothetical protein [Desulfobulbaceae bacterium]
MREEQPAYIAGIGMITPVGANAATTTAAVKAGISGYAVSEFCTREDDSITMGLLPENIFYDFDVELDEGAYFSECYDHIIKMAHIAAQEALEGVTMDNPFPVILGMPEESPGVRFITRESLANNLLKLGAFSTSIDRIQAYSMGRASAIQAIASGSRGLSITNDPYVLIGASDSYFNFTRVRQLSDAGRLLTENSLDGFAPGEGAGFILLTTSIEKALVVEQHVVAVHPPGLAEEPGHLHSEDAYKGEGLHKAFAEALGNAPEKSIDSIYSSMNGENFWAKELGVATVRNSRYLKEGYQIEHPLDCLGDLGAATAPVLIGLAAKDLLFGTQHKNILVYASSDYSWRAAVRLEKIQIH